jgi:hypothetical protein
MGTALGRVWKAHKALVEKVEDHTIRITRLETLMKTLGGDE